MTIQASVFEHDDRVWFRPDGDAVVQKESQRFKVIHGALDWAIYTGSGMDMVGCGHTSRDDAIRSLIGEPAVTA